MKRFFNNPTYFAVDASQAGAGNLEIIVSVNGRHVPNYVQSEGNAKFKVSFKPQEPLPHTLSVRFNGEAVPGELKIDYRVKFDCIQCRIKMARIAVHMPSDRR